MRATPAPLDPAHRIETPESTVLALPVAGIATRGVAYLVDLTLRVMSVLSLLFVLSLFLVLAPDVSSPTFMAMTAAVFAAQWGYFTLFEGLMGGRTPGKLLVAIRVVSEDGAPITLGQAAVRNLIRILDFLPFGYGMGIGLMFAGSAHRRLGDLVAGTVVVRDGVPLLFPDPAPAPADPLQSWAARLRMPGDELDLVRRSVGRFRELAPERQEELGARLRALVRAREADVGPEPAGPAGRAPTWTLLEAVALHARVAGREDRDAFLARNTPRWRRLAALLLAGRGRRVGRLPPRELQELGLLYRRANADLAYAQTFLPRDPLLPPLQALVMESHQLVYRQRIGRPLAALGRFYGETFPRVFRRSIPTIQAALLVFLGFTALGLLLGLTEPRAASLFLSREMLEGLAEGRLWVDEGRSILGLAPGLASGLIINNNISVTFAAFAGGILLGTGSLYVLALNGLMLGVVMAAAARHGLLGHLLEFIAAHGPLELFVIIVAAGAGLLFAGALIAPGPYRRSAALTMASRDAFVLLSGGLPALVVAGIVEGWISPSPIPVAAKAAVGALLLASFLLVAMRPPRRDASLR